MSSGKGGGGGSDAGPMLAYGDKALGLQKEIYDSQRADAQPWYQTGTSAVNQLGMLMGLNPASSAASRQSLLDQYKPQFTTKSPSSSGGMFVGPDRKIYTGSDQNAALKDFRSKNIGQGGMLDGISVNSFTPLNQSSDTTDFSGLNSYVDNFLAQQGSDTESNPLFGSLTRNFGMDDYVEDPGYQFRLSEGNKALERKLNAAGKTYSPEAAKALMGHGQGMASEEYGNAYNRFNNDQGNLFNRLATLSGFGQTATGQVANAGANYANSASDIYTGQGNAIVAANQAKQANNSSMFNTLLAGGANLGAAKIFASDERLKENIERVGEENGFPLYKFNYDPTHPYVRQMNLPTDRTFIGVMAQKVLEKLPEAVSMMNGYYAVNYQMLGFPMREIQ